MGNKGFEDILHHTIVGCLKSWNKYRGIALDGEERCDVQHGWLVSSLLLMGYREEEGHSLIFVPSLIPDVIHYHSNTFGRSATYWVTSYKFSFAKVH